MARTYASPTRYRKRQVIATASMKPLMCIMIVFTVMFAIFFPTTGDPALIFSSTMGSTYTQGNALSNWQVARDATNINDAGYRNQVHQGEYVVTVPGNEQLSLVLTLYNFVAYHTDEIVERSRNNVIPGYSHHDLDFDSIDTRLLGVGLCGTFLNEIGKESTNIDVPEYGGNGDAIQAEWNTYTLDQKIAALLDDDYMINRWSKSYAYYNNALTGKWGYGVIQFTGDRRKNFGLWAQANNQDITQLDVQLTWIPIEWQQTLFPSMEYIISELQGRSADNLDDCKRAVQLIFADTVYHGAKFEVPVGGVCSYSKHNPPDDHTARNVNLDIQNFAGTGMTLYEAIMAWDADPTVFDR